MWIWLVLACGGPQREPVTDTLVVPPSVVSPVTPTVPPTSGPPVSPVVPAVGPGFDPKPAYAKLRARVEEPEAAGECKSNADCAPAGCSREVCTTVTAGPEMMSTCEILPLFSALDNCGCREGMCTWTLKASASGLQPLGLPGMAPQ